MTFQPPPPPPQGPPPGPPGRPTGGFDPTTVNQLDWGIMGAGALAFIFSLFGYYTASAGPYSVSYSAWHGFFGWFATLLALVGAAAVALEIFQPNVKLPAPNRLIGLGAFALALLCTILALFVSPIDTGGFSGISTGNGFGYWVSLIVILAGTALSYKRFTDQGGKLPIGGRKA